MNRRNRRRMGTVVAAPAAALLGWVVIRLIGVNLAVSGPGNKTIVRPIDVFFASLLSALVCLFLVWVLERQSSQPRKRWAQLASSGLAISVIGPSWLADGASAAALIALHVVTAVVVIVGLAGTLPGYRNSKDCSARTSSARPRSGTMTT
jgi:FtsH-binding integral membrane protein